VPAVDLDAALASLQALLRELFHGAAAEGGTWILDRAPGSGLLDTLDALSAKEASARPVPGRATVAGHAHHLRFSLGLLNRWAGGENPFAGADWPGSWRVQTVDDAAWRELRDALRREALAWERAVVAPRTWEPMALTGALASAGHVAYHLGAIRQLAAAARGR